MPLFLSPIPNDVRNQLNLRMSALGTAGPKVGIDKNLEIWARGKTPWIRCASLAVLRPTPTIALRELMRLQKNAENPMSFTQIMNTPEVKANRQNYLIEHEMKNHHRLKNVLYGGGLYPDDSFKQASNKRITSNILDDWGGQYNLGKDMAGHSKKWDAYKDGGKISRQITEQNIKGGLSNSKEFAPMPGVTSLSVENVGQLGSLKKISMSVKCHDFAQLQLIEALYMTPGITCIVEWGWSVTTDGSPIRLQNLEYEKIRQIDQVHQNLAKYSKESGFNQEGAIATVTNYNWKANTDGSFDCSIEMRSRGEAMLGINIQDSHSSLVNAMKTLTTPKEDAYYAEFKGKLSRSSPDMNVMAAQDYMNQFTTIDNKFWTALHALDAKIVGTGEQMRTAFNAEEDSLLPKTFPRFKYAWKKKQAEQERAKLRDDAANALKEGKDKKASEIATQQSNAAQVLEDWAGAVVKQVIANSYKGKNIKSPAVNYEGTSPELLKTSDMGLHSSSPAGLGKGPELLYSIQLGVSNYRYFGSQNQDAFSDRRGDNWPIYSKHFDFAGWYDSGPSDPWGAGNAYGTPYILDGESRDGPSGRHHVQAISTYLYQGSNKQHGMFTAKPDGTGASQIMLDADGNYYPKSAYSTHPDHRHFMFGYDPEIMRGKRFYYAGAIAPYLPSNREYALFGGCFRPWGKWMGRDWKSDITKPRRQLYNSNTTIQPPTNYNPVQQGSIAGCNAVTAVNVTDAETAWKVETGQLGWSAEQGSQDAAIKKHGSKAEFISKWNKQKKRWDDAQEKLKGRGRQAWRIQEAMLKSYVHKYKKQSADKGLVSWQHNKDYTGEFPPYIHNKTWQARGEYYQYTPPMAFLGSLPIAAMNTGGKSATFFNFGEASMNRDVNAGQQMGVYNMIYAMSGFVNSFCGSDITDGEDWITMTPQWGMPDGNHPQLLAMPDSDMIQKAYIDLAGTGVELPNSAKMRKHLYGKSWDGQDFFTEIKNSDLPTIPGGPKNWGDLPTTTGTRASIAGEPKQGPDCGELILKIPPSVACHIGGDGLDLKALGDAADSAPNIAPGEHLDNTPNMGCYGTNADFSSPHAKRMLNGYTYTGAYLGNRWTNKGMDDIRAGWPEIRFNFWGNYQKLDSEWGLKFIKDIAKEKKSLESKYSQGNVNKEAERFVDDGFAGANAIYKEFKKITDTDIFIPFAVLEAMINDNIGLEEGGGDGDGSKHLRFDSGDQPMADGVSGPGKKRSRFGQPFGKRMTLAEFEELTHQYNDGKPAIVDKTEAMKSLNLKGKNAKEVKGKLGEYPYLYGFDGMNNDTVYFHATKEDVPPEEESPSVGLASNSSAGKPMPSHVTQLVSLPVKICNHRWLRSTDPRVCLLPGQIGVVTQTKYETKTVLEPDPKDDSPTPKMIEVQKQEPVGIEPGTGEVAAQLKNFKHFTNDKDKHSYGFLSNILVNTNAIRKAFVDAVTIKDGMEKLLAKITGACGSIWNFKFQIDGENDSGTCTIVDANWAKSHTDFVVEFPVQRTDSIVRSYSMQSKIPNSMAVMALYGNNTPMSEGSMKNNLYELGNMFVDAPHEKISFPKNTAEDKPNDDVFTVPNTIREKIEELTLKTVAIHDFFSETDMSESNQIMKAIINDHAAHNTDDANALLDHNIVPIDSTLEYDGMSGIYFGHAYTTTHLPERYRNEICFQVKNVKHKITTTNWTTELEGIMRRRPKDMQIYTISADGGMVRTPGKMDFYRAFEVEDTTEQDLKEKAPTKTTTMGIEQLNERNDKKLGVFSKAYWEERSKRKSERKAKELANADVTDPKAQPSVSNENTETAKLNQDDEKKIHPMVKKQLDKMMPKIEIPDVPDIEGMVEDQTGLSG